MNIYCKQALTGGVSGCLDAIDGSILSDGDRAIVITSTYTYHLILDADSGLTESSPDIIAPDTNAGSKRWLLVSDGESGGTPETYHTYYPDHTEPDQGAASGGTNQTIKDIVTTIGTSKVAKIVLRHSGSGDTTSYYFDTSLFIGTYNNIFFEIEPGARITSKDASTTLTIYSPGNLFVAKGQIAVGVALAFSMSGTVYPEWFGALGNDSADDTFSIQSAIACLPPLYGGTVEFADKIYRFTELNINKPVWLRGQNRITTVLRTTTASGYKININIGRAVKITDFTIDSTVTVTSGSYIRSYSTSVIQYGLLLRGLKLDGASTCLDLQNCGAFTIDRCLFVNFTTGIYVSNIVTPDNGDSTIINSVFNANNSTGVAIEQRSSGGLRVNSNKFLSGAYHYRGVYSSIGNTGILIFSNNSTESAAVANLQFQGVSPTVFEGIIIEGNQITVSSGATGINVQNSGYQFFNGASIGGNLFNLGNSSYGINLGVGTRVDFLTNTFCGNGSYERGIVFGTGILSASVHRQVFYDLSYGFSGTVTNVAFLDAFSQRGSVSGVCSNAYGSYLYITSPQNVYFSTAFPKAPHVTVTPSSLSSTGVISAIINYVTTSYFQVYIIGANPGQTVGVDWEASLTS